MNKQTKEKIEECSDVCFGIVLYTPCDKGGENKKRAVLKERARQNVIFEHGYLISKLGRDRVCALVKGDVEVPGDIAGIVYIKMDEAGAWKTKIAKEMLENKIDIDPQKLVS